ncbi:hypothetical protein [Oryzibacter oryziterrae]|uniref:hypothetical protein n=1 Tax=Oryzibacter oryziterrae TaxID=2766474 RepID=UPI001F37CADB|nr:hypothetical protein [Oryzibacter oryziterrae]
MDMHGAKSVYARNVTELYAFDGYAAKAGNTMQRHVILGCVMLLHAFNVYGIDQKPVTISRVRRVVEDFADVSAGRVAAHLSFLQKINYIAVTRSATDRRERMLRPTDAMLAHEQEWTATMLEPAAPLGLFDFSEAERDDLAFSLAFRIALAERPDEMRSMMYSHPEMLAMTCRDGAMSALLTLFMSREQTGSDRVAFDLMETAKRFGVSRSQLWSVLEEAAAMGLLVSQAPGWRQVQLTDKLHAAFDAWFFEHMRVMAAAAHRARLIRRELPRLQMPFMAMKRALHDAA